MPQNITVPYLAKEMVVDISGAAGGAGSTGIPGFGARVKSTIVVTAGSVLSIRIGCRGGGEGGAGGYNGGGNSYDGATGGGGASDIRLGGSQLSNRILVAGGGGGIYVYPYCGGIQKGGDGGQIGSAAAQNCANKAAQGGNATAGGTSVCYDNPCPTPGSLGKGGNGGFNHGGGGGGGYYGGGGGCFGGSGGGGSSYSIGSSTVYTSGYQKGDGNATITFYSQSYFYTQLSSFSPTYYEGFPIYGVNSSDTTGSVVNRLGDISGDGLVDVIVTAPAANNYKGVCFVIFGKTGGYHQKFFLSKMTLSQGIKIFGKTNDQLGIAASGLYDFNGDGYNDFAVAGYRPNYSAGVAYVFYGGPGVSNIDCSNLLPSQGFMITGFNGAQLAGAIRLNNDNLGDLILTRQYAGSAAGSAVGLTTVVYGKAGGYASIDLNAGGWTGFTISGAVSEEQSGSSVSAANDFNGDGADDFIIGAPIRSILNPSTGITVAEAGCVYLYLGNKTSNSNIDLSTGSNPRVLTYFLSQTPVSSRFGWSVASNSDLNKDGLNDIIIGAPTYNGVGAACIVYGSRNSSSITYLLNGFNGYCIFGVGGEFGYSLAGVGDLNGDGCGDIAIGARSLGEGRVYIVFGGPTSTTNFAINTLSSDKGYLVIGAAVGDQCGISIASSGDFDGDGYFDILVGARNANGTRGAAYILYGNNYQTAIPTSIPSSQPSSQPSRQPSIQPSGQPTTQPTRQPTSQPSEQPTSQPTAKPTIQPTSEPSTKPTSQPSMIPTNQPTNYPSSQPSSQPSPQPSSQPSNSPTVPPSTQPSSQPTKQPISTPTFYPSSRPSLFPSLFPSSQPTLQPTSRPSAQPSRIPSSQPTQFPTIVPTSQPTSQPSAVPTNQPTVYPSTQPTSRPSLQPSAQPSNSPSNLPSSQPTAIPSSCPSFLPSTFPTTQPTSFPSSIPSRQPSSLPSSSPSNKPSVSPTLISSSRPTTQPTTRPSVQPSRIPSAQPTQFPTTTPTDQPTSQPSFSSTSSQTTKPSTLPSTVPSTVPTKFSSSQPSSKPSGTPTLFPTIRPTLQPTSHPSNHPTAKPTITPTQYPSINPSSLPSNQPTSQPSRQPSAQPTCSPTYYPTTRSKPPFVTVRPSISVLPRFSPFKQINHLFGSTLSSDLLQDIQIRGSYEYGESYVVFGGNRHVRGFIAPINITTISITTILAQSRAASITLGSDSSISLFGVAVSNAGDFNGDGLSDVMISALGKNGDNKIFIIYGRVPPLTSIVISQLPSHTAAPDLTKSPGATLKPSKQPVILPTHQPQTSSSPSARPTILLPLTVRPSPSPTTLTKTSRPSSRRPTAKPSTTSFPTSRPSSHPSFSGVRSIMITAGGKYYSSNGEERFTINTHESLQITNQEGKSRGSKVYIIVPATNLTTITRQIITIDSFDLSSDVIDLSQFTISEGSLVIATYPSLMIQLPTNQWIVLPSYSSFILTEKNIIFPTYTSSSTNNGDSFSMSSVLGWITSSDVLTVIIILITLFIGFFFILNYRKMQFYDFNITKRKKESDVVPEIDHYNSRALEILSDDRQIVKLEERSSSSSIGKIIDEILEVIEKDEIDEESIDDSFCISSDSISDVNDSPIQDSIDSFRSFRSLSGDEASISLLSDDLQSSRQSPNE
eukprot:gene5226-5605_t